MIKRHVILNLLAALITFVSCIHAQPVQPANKFLFFLNSYQIDSLQPLIANNFVLNRTFVPYTNDKPSFLDDYVPACKNNQAIFKILKTTGNDLQVDFWVEDQSAYMKYLNIDYPKWKVTIVTNPQHQIERMTIDTIKDYQAYAAQVAQKTKAFEDWAQKKYPNESVQALYYEEGLLIKRAKEYAARKSSDLKK